MLAAATINSGDTAWVMVSAALVLFTGRDPLGRRRRRHHRRGDRHRRRPRRGHAHRAVAQSGPDVAAFEPISLVAGTGPFVFATWLSLLPHKRIAPVQHDTIAGGPAESSETAV